MMKRALCGLLLGPAVWVLGGAAAELPDLPRPADLATARRIVELTYRPQVAAARTAEARVELATKLIEAAAKSPSPRHRYATLLEAQSLAHEGGDLTVELDAIDAEAGVYRIDLAAARTEAITHWAVGAKLTPDHARAGFERVEQEAHRQMLAERFDTAQTLVKVGRKLAGECKDEAFMSRASDLERDLLGCHALVTRGAAGQERLKARGDDKPANLAVGRYLLMMKRDAGAALPHLVAGSDAGLAELAGRELASPGRPADQLALADAWWAAGEAEPPLLRDSFREHAGRWYRAAAPGLSGIDKMRAEKVAQALAAAAAGPAVEIVKAEWGIDTRWIDVTPKIRSVYQSDAPSMPVYFSTLGNGSAPGKVKSLRVVYTVDGRRKTLSIPSGPDPVNFREVLR